MTFPGGAERLAGRQSTRSWELFAFRDVGSLQERHSRLGAGGGRTGLRRYWRGEVKGLG